MCENVYTENQRIPKPTKCRNRQAGLKDGETSRQQRNTPRDRKTDDRSVDRPSSSP